MNPKKICGHLKKYGIISLMYKTIEKSDRGPPIYSIEVKISDLINISFQKAVLFF